MRVRALRRYFYLRHIVYKGIVILSGIDCRFHKVLIQKLLKNIIFRNEKYD